MRCQGWRERRSEKVCREMAQSFHTSHYHALPTTHAAKQFLHLQSRPSSHMPHLHHSHSLLLWDGEREHTYTERLEIESKGAREGQGRWGQREGETGKGRKASGKGQVPVVFQTIKISKPIQNQI